MLVSCKLINVSECYLKVAGRFCSFLYLSFMNIPREFIVGFGYHREVETMKNQLAMQRKINCN
jgi:hypothetical protein